MVLVGGMIVGSSNSAVVHTVAVAMLVPVWNRTTLVFGWLFTLSGSSVPVTLITGTNLTGIEMVTVSDGLRTMVPLVECREKRMGRGWCVLQSFLQVLSLNQQHLLFSVSCDHKLMYTHNN